MAKKNSSLINSSIAHTPSSPLYARPHSTGRPTNTAFAPSASALNTSVPLRTPPSISTGIFPSTASTTSATASIVAVTVSSCRPPWLLTIIPSTPLSTASTASSLVSMPLTSTGSFVLCLSHFMSSHVNPGSSTCEVYFPSHDLLPALPTLSLFARFSS